MDIKKITVSGASAMMLMGTMVPCMAAGTVVDGDLQNSKVTVEAAATSMDITVPTAIPVVLNADGSNTTPSDWKILNNHDLYAIHLEDAKFTGTNGWELGADGFDYQNQAKDTKKLSISMTGEAGHGGYVNAADGTLGFSHQNIAANGEQQFTFDVQRGAFTAPVTIEDAYNVVLNFAYPE